MIFLIMTTRKKLLRKRLRERGRLAGVDSPMAPIFEIGVPTSHYVRKPSGRLVALLTKLATKAHGHLVGSVAPPVEPIDLRYCDVEGEYVRTQLMQKLYYLKKLSEDNKTPFIAEQITSAVAGCALWPDWRVSVTRPAYANRRRNYSSYLCLENVSFDSMPHSHSACSSMQKMRMTLYE